MRPGSRSSNAGNQQKKEEESEERKELDFDFSPIRSE